MDASCKKETPRSPIRRQTNHIGKFSGDPQALSSVLSELSQMLCDYNIIVCILECDINQ